jgi:signal transduction histidine kinase
MRNLVDNALKYGKQPVVVSAIHGTEKTRCLVLDSGNGVDPAQTSMVFEPYTRLVDNPTMSSPGLGLGLPIVRELVTAHGGEVHMVKRDGFTGFEFTPPRGLSSRSRSRLALRGVIQHLMCRLHDYRWRHRISGGLSVRQWNSYQRRTT